MGNDFSEQQRAVIEYDGDRHMLVLAGPGSGKTSTVVARAARLMQRNMGMNLLLMTFSRKAAQEMKERLRAQRIGGMMPLITTYHGLGWWLIQRDSKAYGFNDPPTIMDDADAKKLLKSVIPRMEPSEFDVGALLLSVIERAAAEGVALLEQSRSVLQRLVTEVIKGEEALQGASSPLDVQTIIDVLMEYQKEKNRQSLLDYSDLQSLPLLRMQEHPESFKWFFERFKEVFIDEAQDTNLAQYRLIESIGAHAKDIRFVQVGDDDQTIYGWRGARHENMLEFQTKFSPEVFRLEDNFRSVEEIVVPATRLVRHNQERFDKNPIIRRSTNGQVLALFFPDDDAMLDAMVEELDSGNQKSAIIVRTNRMVEAVERKLLRAGIDYDVQQGIELLDHRETKLFMSLVRLMVNPHDEMAFRYLGAQLIEGLGSKGIEKVCDIHRMKQEDGSSQGVLQDFAHYLMQQKKVPAWWMSVEHLHRLMWEISKVYPESFELGLFLGNSLISKWFEKVEPEEKKRVVRRSRLETLVEALRAHVPESAETPQEAWYGAIDVMITGQSMKKEAANVTVMTAHRSKGLEFDRVFLPYLCEGVFPSIRNQDREEERRLMYVAMTRAKDFLWMAGCKSIRALPEYYGKEFRPSSYLREAGVSVRRMGMEEPEVFRPTRTELSAKLRF